MTDDVDGLIDALKRRFHVATDQGLAERLRVGRSTVTSWRRRGTVPERYARFAGDSPTSLPDFHSPEFDDAERCALVLALVRLIRKNMKYMVDYPGFLSKGQYLPARLAVGVETALLEITAKMQGGELIDAMQALNLIVYEELARKG